MLSVLYNFKPVVAILEFSKDLLYSTEVPPVQATVLLSTQFSSHYLIGDNPAAIRGYLLSLYALNGSYWFLSTMILETTKFPGH